MSAQPARKTPTAPATVFARIRAAGRYAVTLMRNAANAANLTAEKQAVEAQLARERDEWNAGVLRLADALGMDAHETRQALIRESFIAAQRADVDPPSGS